MVSQQSNPLPINVKYFLNAEYEDTVDDGDDKEEQGTGLEQAKVIVYMLGLGIVAPKTTEDFPRTRSLL